MKERYLVEVNDADNEEIARQIKKGCTSGILYDGEGKSISWKLETNAWKEEEGYNKQ